MSIDADDRRRRRGTPRTDDFFESEQKPNYEEQQPLSSDTPALKPQRRDKYGTPIYRGEQSPSRPSYRNDATSFDRPRRERRAPFNEPPHTQRDRDDRGRSGYRNDDGSNYRDRGGYADRDRPQYPRDHDRPQYPRDHDRPQYPRDHDRPQYPRDRDRPQYPRDRESGYRNREGYVGGGGFAPRDDDRYAQEPRRMRSRYRDSYERNERTPRPPARQRPTNVTKALVRLLYASRGFALKIIKQGEVTVNDRPVRNVNAPVRLLNDEVRVRGNLLAHSPRGIYIAMNKPKKFAGARDPDSRHIMNLISKKSGWSIPLGPLAKSASGIVILTNDPEQRNLNNNVFALMEKEYCAKIRLPEKELTDEQLKSIAASLENTTHENGEGVRVQVAQVNTRSMWLSITVRRAKYHDITKSLHNAGLHILAMERRRIGSISVDDLPAGSWRRLSVEEVQEVITQSVQKEEIQELVSTEVTAPDEEKTTWRTLYQRWFKST